MGKEHDLASRRRFLLGVGATTGALACHTRDETATGGAAAPSTASPTLGTRAASTGDATTGMPKRKLGRTDVMVSMLGLGGSHIGQGSLSDEEAIRIIHRALDSGFTFLDNCWDYNGGRSEERVGKALQGGWRERAFLMTKIDGRTRDAASAQLDQSLARLKTDHIDLVQIHEVIRMEDPGRCFAPGGTIEALVAAKRAGKIRFIGFTGHKHPSIHLAMLKTAKEHDFEFDTVQMPLNVMDAQYESFERAVLPVLTERGIGVLGMKSMGSGDILKSGVVKPEECLRYALSLPTSVVITGIDSEKVLDQALAVARSFRPYEPPERMELLARAADSAKSGKYELFKTSDKYDGTVANKHWLEEARL
jgi:aryl-alcohol dehydrogenase-like predicted oxidoreductase